MKVAMIARTALAALLALAPAAAQAQPAGEFTKRMLALNDIQRRGAVRGAIVNNGLWCGRMGPTAHQGRWKNLDMWVARCNGRTPKERSVSYGVFLGPDGDVQVRSCEDLVALKLPRCNLALLPAR
jgi:hypothetical protein